MLVLLLLLPGVELEDGWAIAIVANIDNESRLSPITENKTIRISLLLFLLDMRGLTINCYVRIVGNKQFKGFTEKVFTNFVLSS
jgi:hypothetical protein